ncbi:unnamed protein product [Hermetia illucens]|uniref:Kynurenine 3-monooxygenase n=1 Tax=Hermetia illucens TaxID=343691 RepID=A0A7R8UAG7_HERIL|nr:kynurenine 3-monooxygenase [Hermetia illucens]CAD7077183.1 unnamed protein product [Hermetia illucens]
MEVNGDTSNGKIKKTLNIAIIGGGLVGSMAALHLGKKGHQIHLYEYREDIRKAQLAKGRSINLSLSARGRVALAEVGLEEELLQHGIPMYGRMLHDLNGNMTFVPYDRNTKQCIYSVGRKKLNEILLNTAEKYTNIHFNFNRKLISARFREGQMEFKDPITNELHKATADLVIGCDGAYSAVRKNMLSTPGFNFSQSYIQHGYLELCIPALDGQFAMPHNYLHIWPRGEFMMIALPNQDKTWTVTLFMPFKKFEDLKSACDLVQFFDENFPDAIPLIGEKRLISDFFSLKPQHLISIKCYPYHISSKVLLLGDAAHAMVPFYGQGMNAGFEDCTILSRILDNPNVQIADVLKSFSECRHQDAHAICDLAMYNYIEMRDLVRTRKFRIRKALDEFLHKLMPLKWIPLYNSVTFTTMPYRKCLENRNWQDKVLTRTFATILTFTGCFVIVYLYNIFFALGNRN